MWKRLPFVLFSCSVLCCASEISWVACCGISIIKNESKTSNVRHIWRNTLFFKNKKPPVTPRTTMQTIPGAPQEWFLELFRAFQSLIQPLDCGRQAREQSQGNGHNHVRMMRSSFLNSRNNALASRCRLSSAKYLILFFHHRPSFWLRHKASKLSIKTWFKKVRAHTGWINGSRAYIAAAVISQI